MIGVTVSLIARLIWNTSEYTGISLGRFAPRVFELMINRKGHECNRAKEDKN